MYLEELMGSVRLEGEEYECKARLDRVNSTSWLKTVCGFSNADGGTLLIGVEDKSNKLIGFTRQEADTERNYLNNQINEHITPRPQYRISFLRYEVRGAERFVMQVEISPSPYKPVILKYNGVPSIYMRRQGFTNGATYEEIVEMSRRSKPVQYDLLPAEETYRREDFSDLFAFCKAQGADESLLSDKALVSMGFMSPDGTLSNGAVLFRDGYQGDKTEIQCSVFSGFNKGSERIVSLNRYNGNITGGIRYMLDYVRQRMNHSVIKLSSARIDIDAFPDRALFEGIVNAVAHRDYEMDRTQIQVDLFRDRLEITSPGGFFQRNGVKKTYDLSSIISRRRNELISSVLVRCNAMEAAGTGFEKIEEAYRSADARHKPYICAESDHFTLVLPDLTYEAGVQSDGMTALEFMPVAHGTKHDQSVLEYCYSSPRTVREISERLGVSNSTYLRKNIIGNLVSAHCLRELVIEGKRAYQTVPDAVRVI